MNQVNETENVEIIGYLDEEILEGYRDERVIEIYNFLPENFRILRSSESLIVLVKKSHYYYLYLAYGGLKEFYSGLIRAMVNRVSRTIDKHLLQNRIIFNILEKNFDVPSEKIDEIIREEKDNLHDQVIQKLIDLFFKTSGKNPASIQGKFKDSELTHKGLWFTTEKGKLNLTDESMKKFTDTILEFQKLVQILIDNFEYLISHDEDKIKILRKIVGNTIVSIIIFYKKSNSVYIFLQSVVNYNAVEDLKNSIIKSVFGNIIKDFNHGKEILSNEQIGLDIKKIEKINEIGEKFYQLLLDFQ